MLLVNDKINKSVGFNNDLELLHNFITFVVAGMDTTGHLLTTLVFYLKKHTE